MATGNPASPKPPPLPPIQPPRALSALPLQKRAAEIVRRLAAEYPASRIALDHRDAYQLLVATILAAQCTDERVNQVTPALFARFPDGEALAGAGLAELEELVKSTGFYRNKARALSGLGQALAARHGGQVPRSMAALVDLPGVGRKTANVVLGNAFGDNVGVVVDTHVHRVSRRLGLTAQDKPEAIEADLMAIVPQADWTRFSHLLIDHGRQVCKAQAALRRLRAGGSLPLGRDLTPRGEPCPTRDPVSPSSPEPPPGSAPPPPAPWRGTASRW
jgi:endonuclease-3